MSHATQKREPRRKRKVPPDLIKLATTTRPAEQAIIAAGVATFTRLGFAATRVEDILQSAGIARRTFYKYYSGKEAVLGAVYDLATSELLKTLRSIAASSGDPFEAVKVGLDLYLDYHLENASLARILVESAMHPDSPLAEARRRFRAELARLLNDTMSARKRPAYDPMVYAAMISAIEGISLDLLVQRSVSLQDVKRAKAAFHLLLTRVFET